MDCQGPGSPGITKSKLGGPERGKRIMGAPPIAVIYCHLVLLVFPWLFLDLDQGLIRPYNCHAVAFRALQGR